MKARKDAQTLKWIRSISGRHLRWPAALLVTRLLQGYTCVQYAYLLGDVVDQAAAGVGDAFYRQLFRFVLLVLLTLVLQAFGRYAAEKSKVMLEKTFRLHVFSQLLCRDYARVSGTHTGEWMTRIVSDTHVVALAVATIVPELAGALSRMLGALLSLLTMVPQVALIILPCGLIMTAFSYFARKRMKRYHKDAQRADGRVRAFMQERLSSLLVVRTFTQESATAQQADRQLDDFVAARMRRFRFVNFSLTAFGVAVNSAHVLGIGFCGWGILTGAISYGTMSTVLYLINLLEAPLASASSYLSQYYSMLASAERLMDIEEFAPDSNVTPVSAEAARQYYDGSFASFGLENAVFSYADGENSFILDNFNLDVPKGSFIAFTGESGCGKSTALKVLLSLYPLLSGSAYLQDHDGSRQTLDAGWRSLFAYVPQGNQLICGTIRETLTFGDPTWMAREDDIHRALEIACAEEFVRELPDGLDTVLGERGSGLSEGQMQRLSVARAVLSGRPVLLLDEATSALDAATEEQLLKNLRAMTDRTVLIVTHREAALDFCDRKIQFTNLH